MSEETIVRHDFALGKLPFRREDGSWYMSRQEWLIVPLYEDGQLVGLRGRNLGGFGPKWISATGSSYTLWGVDQVKPGSVVWLCENYVDAAWLMQEYPEWSAVAIGGATTWRAEWADRMAARRPELVVVALDNDLAGAARGETLRRLQQEWIQERGTRPPRPNGPRIVNSLRRAGVNALLFRWPEEAPVKAGLDWILAQRQKAAA
ncbi:toprim domain-containing protein [Caldilinea sp.]|uniref:toprim domain-containing protein n=1 Tax=Caldilinea sp. TaxID=2293560 RepID=UPI00258B6859|nr:toprim domain-containing protein [Caldilinea sp.]